ncbi:MBL fold metallo-hydrolase [Nocardia terpenica]|uniref:MBL fold metallo-hydrolase n=1 Tax=Nocardia terpenica TaxID=455432 RepID=UPI001893F499|nr:MBL fold metallo-hydrolase [Nocardia terpenica]MBF6059504.1 MBL fold metallo-hydrolase [Nocardia terpenica]MBF6102957.1 MBL fold metallo-hydrolase [Nocardia terpenica]MBF6110854.1 MBL fold metallo-hydrolase [Nocardia terpenica]MBF6116985.1 MBL fold metallo-hydrolase [Nocardia terpenica]MBF6151177.1 MBL fold metallo-hydrolase [Nocardia terpenica]
MTVPPYTAGLHRVGPHTYAYLQPDGSWGWSNAGLVVDGRAALLVDTLFTLPLTERMLRTIAAELPGVEIGTVVNTHDDGDHAFGNQLLPDARIIASAATADHMRRAPSVDHYRDLIVRANAGEDGVVAEFTRDRMGVFDLTDVVSTPPTTTFSGETTVAVGETEVRLIQVGPAHTAGDVLVEVPGDAVLFTGDILFVDAHPVVHSGPVQRWVAACDLILGLDVRTIVPGHGRIVGKPYVERFRDYLVRVAEHAERSLRRGATVVEAARDFPLADYADWADAERIVLNLGAAYLDLGGPAIPENDLFAVMAELWAAHRGAR